MNKKKIFIPILGMFGGLLVVMLLVFPMLSMNVKNIPVGVISQDQGAMTQVGKVNAGNKVVEEFVKSNNKVISFKEVKSKKKLDDDLDKGKYYATITVPKDFTKNVLTKKDNKINVVINEGINPMVTMQLASGLNALGDKSGLSIDIVSINSVAKYGLKAMILPMMIIIMTFITSLITSFLITLNIDDKNKNKVRRYLKQLVYIIPMSFAIGFTVTSIAIGIAGIDVNIVKPALYITLVSFVLMLLVNGSVKLFGKKGIVIPMILFILGMALASIPYEFLNSVWKILIASWEPFRYIGSGLREVLYQGHGVFNSSFLCLLIVGLIGVLFSVISMVKKKDKE